MNESIIFIGPMGVGKSSVARAVASILRMDYVDVDELRWDYFSAQPDFDGLLVERLFNEGKGAEAFHYMKPFEARYAIDILSKYPCTVLDFGAGYTVYQNQDLFETVKAAFAKFNHIVFLRYSDDPSESLEALRTRHADVPTELYDALNKDFIESPCNEMLATYIIDTKNKSIEAVTSSVLDRIHMKKKELYTGKTAAYSSARPSYAGDFIDYLFSDEIGLNTGDAVADIGSGTGIFSKMLLDRGCRVWGVEHNAEMRTEAEKRLGAYMNFISVNGSAESSGLEPGCADMVTATSAFHWFDTQLFKKECLRILRPGGKVVLCWNVRTETSPFDLENAEVCRKYCKSFTRFNHGFAATLPKVEAFFDGKFTSHRFKFDLLFDQDTFTNRILSSSYALKPGDVGMDDFVSALHNLFDRYSSDGRIALGNETVAYIGALSCVKRTP